MEQVLADAGITPDSSKKYQLSDVQSALSKFFGKEVTVRCRDGAINELWYFYNVKGSAQSGKYVPADPGKSSRMFSFSNSTI